MRHRLVLLTLLVALTTACGVSRRSSDPGGEVMLMHSRASFLEQYALVSPAAELQASGRLQIRQGGESVRVPVRYSLVRDRSLVLSIRPLAIVEAGRIDVIGGTLLVQDRMNRRYFRATLNQMDLGGVVDLMGINPSLLRAIVQNEPFTKSDIGRHVLTGMKMNKLSGRYVFESSRGDVRHEYDQGLRLVRSFLRGGMAYEMEVRYTDFGHNGMPLTTELEVTASGKTYLISLNLTKVDGETTLTADTTPPVGYKEVGVKELMTILKNI